MTVSKSVKNEIIDGLGKLEPCCKMAFLSAVIRAAGSLVINKNGFGVSVTGENRQLILLIKQIVSQLYGDEYKVDVLQNTIKNQNIYGITVTDSEVLADAGIIFFDRDGTQIVNRIDPYLVCEQCCKKNFVKGLFLGCGTVTLPTLKNINEDKKSSVGYYLEFNLCSQEVAEDLHKLLNDLGFGFKLTTRGDKHVVYVKDSDTVSDMLAFLNANNAVLLLQNLLIQRTLRNNANRQSNCITANIDKSVAAAEKQIADIELIFSKKGERFLTPPLLTAAKARMDNPSASMEELAEFCKITKSGINHRMKRISLLATKIAETKED